MEVDIGGHPPIPFGPTPSTLLVLHFHQLSIFSSFFGHACPELFWGINDLGGYWWPPTYSIWTYTINSFNFSSSAQFTIFSNSSGDELPELFWGTNDLGGYWWPQTYSIWTPTIVYSIFPVSAQLTIFSSFSGPEPSEPFWSPKGLVFGKSGEAWVYELLTQIS